MGTAGQRPQAPEAWRVLGSPRAGCTAALILPGCPLPSPTGRVWSGGSLAPLQCISNGPGWVSDCVVVEGAAIRKLAVAAQDRTVGAWAPACNTLLLFFRLCLPVPASCAATPSTQHCKQTTHYPPHPNHATRTTPFSPSPPLPPCRSPSTTPTALDMSSAGVSPAPAAWAPRCAWACCRGGGAAAARSSAWCGGTQVG